MSIWRIFFSFRWEQKNEPSRYLELYEPYLVYASEKSNPTGKYQPLLNGRAKGLEVNDMAALPQYPMFLQKSVTAQVVSGVISESVILK